MSPLREVLSNRSSISKNQSQRSLHSHDDNHCDKENRNMSYSTSTSTFFSPSKPTILFPNHKFQGNRRNNVMNGLNRKSSNYNSTDEDISYDSGSDDNSNDEISCNDCDGDQDVTYDEEETDVTPDFCGLNKSSHRNSNIRVETSLSPIAAIEDSTSLDSKSQGKFIDNAHKIDTKCVSDEDSTLEDESSGGSTVVRFDLSHLVIGGNEEGGEELNGTRHEKNNLVDISHLTQTFVFDDDQQVSSTSSSSSSSSSGDVEDQEKDESNKIYKEETSECICNDDHAINSKPSVSSENDDMFHDCDNNIHPDSSIDTVCWKVIQEKNMSQDSDDEKYDDGSKEHRYDNINDKGCSDKDLNLDKDIAFEDDLSKESSSSEEEWQEGKDLFIHKTNNKKYERDKIVMEKSNDHKCNNNNTIENDHLSVIENDEVFHDCDEKTNSSPLSSSTQQTPTQPDISRSIGNVCLKENLEKNVSQVSYSDDDESDANNNTANEQTDDSWKECESDQHDVKLDESNGISNIDFDLSKLIIGVDDEGGKYSTVSINKNISMDISHLTQTFVLDDNDYVRQPTSTDADKKDISVVIKDQTLNELGKNNHEKVKPDHSMYVKCDEVFHDCDQNINSAPSASFEQQASPSGSSFASVDTVNWERSDEQNMTEVADDDNECNVPKCNDNKIESNDASTNKIPLKENDDNTVQVSDHDGKHGNQSKDSSSEEEWQEGSDLFIHEISSDGEMSKDEKSCEVIILSDDDESIQYISDSTSFDESSYKSDSSYISSEKSSSINCGDESIDVSSDLNETSTHDGESINEEIDKQDIREEETFIVDGEKDSFNLSGNEDNESLIYASGKNESLNDGKSEKLSLRTRDKVTKELFQCYDAQVFNGELRSVNVSWSKRLNTTAGITKLKTVGGGLHKSWVASIELSTKVVDDEYRLKSTLMHEMCHAAAWIIDHVHKPPHGKCFKKWANLAMNRVPDVLVTTTHNYQIAYKYAWACTTEGCSVLIKRHSRSVDAFKHCCGKCKGKLIEIDLKHSEVKTDVSQNIFTPKKKHQPTAFNLFVKENSALVRSKLATRKENMYTTIKQSDVMKECASLWKEQKIMD